VITYRDLATLDEFAEVVELERLIWGPGYDDAVPVPILAVSVHCGGILIGAFDGVRMIGFVYSLPGIKDGRAIEWSHMLGVVEGARNEGVGDRLKRMQRDRALVLGLDLIEWTFDPMQAMNAHLNFAKLGVVVQEYRENLYGNSASPLHKGNPTDRFVAQWWIRTARVEQRLAGSAPMAPAVTVEPANRARSAGRWLEPAEEDLSLDARRIGVEIPMGFTELLSQEPDLALEWRMATRRIFTAYLARGYQAIEFFLERPARKGAYLLTRRV
jgi:predicted GNAT superfamily acetyltransferase